MAQPKSTSDSGKSHSRARTPEAREQQIASQAYDLAEKQIGNGSASSQVITHFLKMGSTREQLEQERMRHEIELMEVKKEHMESLARTEELFTEAIKAMKTYSGSEPPPEDDPDAV
jgi:RecB family exonuclease